MLGTVPMVSVSLQCPRARVSSWWNGQRSFTGLSQPIVTKMPLGLPTLFPRWVIPALPAQGTVSAHGKCSFQHRMIQSTILNSDDFLFNHPQFSTLQNEMFIVTWQLFAGSTCLDVLEQVSGPVCHSLSRISDHACKCLLSPKTKPGYSVKDYFKKIHGCSKL